MTEGSGSQAALGDTGPWVRHLGLAWRALADPAGSHPFLLPPDGRGHIAEWDTIAWWSPALHLLTSGLGWPGADPGLARWWEAERPTGDDRLALLDRWWGEDTVEPGIP